MDLRPRVASLASQNGPCPLRLKINDQKRMDMIFRGTLFNYSLMFYIMFDRLFTATLQPGTSWLESENDVRWPILEWQETYARKTSTKGKQRFLVSISRYVPCLANIVIYQYWYMLSQPLVTLFPNNFSQYIIARKSARINKMKIHCSSSSTFPFNMF